MYVHVPREMGVPLLISMSVLIYGTVCAQYSWVLKQLTTYMYHTVSMKRYCSWYHKRLWHNHAIYFWCMFWNGTVTLIQVCATTAGTRVLYTHTGSNGQDFMFLLKGHEDLRQDERVMQLFGLVNTLLANDPETFKRHLRLAHIRQNWWQSVIVKSCTVLHNGIHMFECG